MQDVAGQAKWIAGSGYAADYKKGDHPTPADLANGATEFVRQFQDFEGAMFDLIGSATP
jgi:hypothetical protein